MLMQVIVMVVAFCFQVPMWLPYSPLRTQQVAFAVPQPYGVYPRQAYVPPGDGLWPTPGFH